MLAASERQALRGEAPKADSCILVFLNGGPSHLDMWDMKPDLPKEMRSEFKPIATVGARRPGLRAPAAAVAADVDHCTLVRSVHHDQVAHAPAVYTALTGIRSNVRAGILGAKPTDHPAIGSVVGRFRPPASNVAALRPAAVPDGGGGGRAAATRLPGRLAGEDARPVPRALGRAGNLNLPALTPGRDMTAERVRDRGRLLAGAESQRRPCSGAARPRRWSASRRGPATCSPPPPRSGPSSSTRNRPGCATPTAGTSTARACCWPAGWSRPGTRLACISWAPDANATWDTHGNNFTKLKNDLLPPFDLGFSRLLTDLTDRGLLERTLVVVMGEIGRTPKINSGAGRDHWEFCYTVLFAGGGVKGGLVHGASDKHGAYPSQNPVTASDIVATIYHALGIPVDLDIHDRQNRPMLLNPEGVAVREVFG